MKNLLFPLALAFFVLATGCGKDDPTKKITEGAKELGGDLKAKMGDAMNIVKDVGGKFADIKDMDTAKSVSAAVAPMIDKLAGMKSMLGKFDFSALTKAAEGLKTKFAGDAGIMGVLKPLLDKITSLVG